MGSWYVVLKRIKGRLYAYRQRTYRDHEAVRAVSEYIGRADHLAPLAQKRGLGQVQLTLQGHPLLEVATLPDRKALRAWEEGRLVDLKPAEILPQSEEALLAYMRNGFEPINKALRGEIPMTPELKRQILGIRAAIYHDRAVLMENVTLYRACLIPLHKLRVGEKISQQSIVSFSVDIGVSREFLHNSTIGKKGYIRCILVNIAQKGDNRYYSMSGMGGGEFEIITSNSLFEIISIKKELGTIYVTVGKVGNDI